MDAKLHDVTSENFPRRGSFCSGSEQAFSVEARLNYVAPRVIAGEVLDNRWRAIRFVASSVGVPSRQRNHGGDHGLLDYPAAQALRWWFVAEAAKNYDELCLETRLVRHLVKYTYEVTVQAPVCDEGIENYRHACNATAHEPAALDSAEAERQATPHARND